MSRTLKALVAAALLFGLWAGTAKAQDPPAPLPEPKVVPIQVTGPPTQRLNLIVMGDGYQADQQSLFRADLDRNLAVMWATEPFRTYRNYINVYAVELASIDYGVRCDPDGRKRHPDGTIRDTGEREGPINTKQTALKMIFDGGCSNPLARGTVYANPPANPPAPGCENFAAYYPAGVNPCETGNQAHNRIIENYVSPVLGIPRTSQNIQTLAIFNTFTYGGIGGTQATTSGGSPQGPLISLHELGHSLGTMADEYPYSSRDVVRPCYTGGEPNSFHHTLLTAPEMLTRQVKWWRWLGEESLSGGIIGTHEGGGTYPCGQKRPSQHSMMRWIGFDFDQIGLEHMVARVTGMRNAGQMNVQTTPTTDAVAKDQVLWVEPGNPRFHAVDVTWRSGSGTGPVIGTGRNLDLEPLNLAPGTTIHAEVRDPVGPDGIDWVRNPSTNNSAADSGFNGPRFVQTRTWTVGESTVTADPAAADITAHTANTRPLAGDEFVYVNTNHPADRVLPVTWTVNGTEVPNTANRRTLDLGSLNLPSGTHTLVAKVTDGALSDSVEWKIDNVDPTAARRLSAPAAKSTSDDHGIYFNGWDMWLDPKDDTTGYEGTPAVVGQFRLNRDGWFVYFGFPEKPMPESPYEFRHSGQVVKALTYGNLGTGGISKAGFEQTLPDDHPSGGFIPGFGTHTVEHRAIDPAGNYSIPESYTATALPGAQLTCATSVTGNQASINAAEGVTCVDGATVSGTVTVAAGASLLLKNTTVGGTLDANGAEAVQVIGSTVTGATKIANSTKDVTLAGSAFKGGLSLTGNTQVTANERYSRLAGAYGPVVAGNTVNGTFECANNSAAVKDFGAANRITGASNGCAATAVSPELPISGTVPATLSLTLASVPAFPTFVPGVTRDYTTTGQANVISTAGNAALTVSEPGHLTNGAFTLAEPLRVELSKSMWTGPVSNEKVDVTYKQLIKDKDPLRTGTYSKTLTFTLSTTQP
ncbi:peptidase M64 [Solirubrobacter sp. CPCC 204708]|uniref:M64 family metallo-endopeptidase n=1 Tax=Solirubrobacter deserti TaxID=2282478 RepID=A0ABT4RD36_9ACTN|nr:M64 family metallopeptidase [Solirubrobacter deserti]MBE2315656.1 peptidase M64 [Solirubrobacter deserti]MDA0136296.1 M64 family metallo-endopeptidase [Solirubrobacter deserti]